MLYVWKMHVDRDPSWPRWRGAGAYDEFGMQHRLLDRRVGLFNQVYDVIYRQFTQNRKILPNGR